jgi:hypothetical protein
MKPDTSSSFPGVEIERGRAVLRSVQRKEKEGIVMGRVA